MKPIQHAKHVANIARGALGLQLALAADACQNTADLLAFLSRRVL